MGREVHGEFYSSYKGQQIDALLAAMAQANPLPDGVDWVAFIDDCREAQESAETAAASVAGLEETCEQSAISAASSARAANDAAERAERATSHVDLPIQRGGGINSVVIGSESNTATGNYAVAEGHGTLAERMAGHAEGVGTVARFSAQHVFGAYNIPDPRSAFNPKMEEQVGNFIEIVGNGTSEERSNARTLDWNGNEKISGKLTLGAMPTEEMDAATKKYVDDAISDGGGNCIPMSEKGAINGVAELDSTGRVPSSQLPSYVDDVLEYSSLSEFPSPGEPGKIYVAASTNKTYRWNGSSYTEISSSLAIGETSSTAYAGNKGKANADAISAIKNGASIDSFGDVETALAGKQDVMTIDKIPEADSTNPVMSGGVWSSLKARPSAPSATSVSVGGLAAFDKNIEGTLTKLKTVESKGSATRGIYLDSNGIPQQMSYTVGKSVPSDAKFTDTNTTYTITQDTTDGHKITLTGSDGTSKTITIPDNDTTYSLNSLGIGNVKNLDQSKAIKSISRSGTTFTYTCLDGTTGTFTQQDNNTWTAMVGATSSASGSAGYVPAPPKDGYNTKYLRADGTWAVPPDTDTKYSEATTTLAGLMSAADKTKLNELDTALANKVDKITGKGLSTNDYTTAEKNKLAGIAAGAEVNVQSDWNATSGDAKILNKPSLGTAAEKNVPANGNASVAQVVLGNDTRLSDARTPTSHASGDTTYGVGSYRAYGHVRLSDVADVGLDVDGGFAVTPRALAAAIAVAEQAADDLGGKVDKEAGKGLSTNDYTAADKSKVDSLGAAASKGVTTSVDTSTSLPTANAVRSYVESRIEAAVSGALVPGGSVTFANLPAAIAANCNRIYNIEDAFTTTASFKEGVGKSYPAGTNVAIINVGTASSPVYKYDAYTGTYDLSVFLEGSEATDSEVDAMIAEVFGAQP